MTQIVAEIGVNWFGDISIAKEMIVGSKKAGADAVKFQLFNEDVVKDSQHREALYNMILDEKDIAKLWSCAKDNKLKFGVSTMYPEAFDVIKNVRMNFLKIRYADRHNSQIAELAIEYAKNKDTKIFVSCDSFFVGSRLRYDTCDTYDKSLYAFPIYCIPYYPPKLSDINIQLISNMYFYGYSNHYPSKFLPMLAVSRELDYIEVHVKPNPISEMVYDGRIDNSIDKDVSLSFGDLSDICKFRDLILQLNEPK